jgi:hypothetical protein
VRCSFNNNFIQEQTGAGRPMRIYRETDLKIINSSFIDRESLPYRDGNIVRIHNHTSTCQESTEGYRVSGVGLIMTSSTIVFDSTKHEGSCESINAT